MEAGGLTNAELGTIVGIYVGWIVVLVLFATLSKLGGKIFSIYSASLMRVAALISLVCMIGALSLYYIEAAAIFFVAGMIIVSLFAVLYFFVTRNNSIPSRRLSIDNAFTMVALLIYLFLPVGLTLWKRDDMSPTVEWVVMIGTGLFWLFGVLAYYFKKDFDVQVNPFGKTVTMMVFLSISMWMILYAGNEYATLLVLTLSLFSFMILSLYRNDRLLSLSLRSHQKHPTIAAFLVGTVVYGMILCLFIATTKDQQDRDDHVFSLTILLGVFGLLWIIGVVVFNSIEKMNTNKNMLADDKEPSIKDKVDARGEMEVFVQSELSLKEQ